MANRAADDECNSRYHEVVGNLAAFYESEYHFLRPLYDRVKQNCAGRLLLDVGCGIGAQSAAASRCGFSVVALDHSLSGLSIVNRHAVERGEDMHTVMADALEPPFPPDVFDVVQCLGNVVLLQDTMADAERLLTNLVLLCKAGGVMILGLRPYRPAEEWQPEARVGESGLAYRRITPDRDESSMTLELGTMSANRRIDVLQRLRVLSIEQAWVLDRLKAAGALLWMEATSASDFKYQLFVCHR